MEGGEANVLLLELVPDLLGKGDVYLWEPAAPPTKLTPICQANISISADLSMCFSASACLHMLWWGLFTLKGSSLTRLFDIRQLRLMGDANIYVPPCVGEGDGGPLLEVWAPSQFLYPAQIELRVRLQVQGFVLVMKAELMSLTFALVYGLVFSCDATSPHPPRGRGWSYSKVTLEQRHVTGRVSDLQNACSRLATPPLFVCPR